ncbi:MAG: arginine--tRNA ligase [Verrucomicrobiota bacterium]
MTIQTLLESRLTEALGAPTQVSATADARFGDYQTNAAMVAAKAQRANPRQVAAQMIERINVSDFCEPLEIAGAGFINFRLKPEFVAQQTRALLDDAHLGVPQAAQPRKIVLDFSSPNVAKPMHVGHIRSTILGDTLTRIARFLGHEVITDNHIGDWGTQFGKVIYGWKHFRDDAALERNAIQELVRLYKQANTLADTDATVMTACREELVKLQAGDAENLDIWKRTVALSWKEFEAMYGLLDIHFDEHLGESFYNDALAPLVDRLLACGIAEVSEGAVCVFFRDNPALADKPCLIRKSDGGFLYATTDLATIEYRIARWNADAIWYVVGAPQALHFEQIFATAARMGITGNLRHVAFGSILGEDRKLMKTRSGENVGLRDVLEEAQERSLRIVEEKNPDMPAEQKAEIARIIGIGAVKYAELSQFRMSDYVFSWDKMLSFQGNTAPYLQNAYVRIRSIFRKLGSDFTAPATLALTEPAEFALSKKLLQFGETVPQIIEDFRPNLLANYLYELANTFHGFYEACPVLKSEGATKESRLALCELTARVLREGLGLLGIRVPERM